MNTNINHDINSRKCPFILKNLFECVFKSDKGTRTVSVVASTFGKAASYALTVSSGWEDSDAFELMSISLVDVVVTF